MACRRRSYTFYCHLSVHNFLEIGTVTRHLSEDGYVVARTGIHEEGSTYQSLPFVPKHLCAAQSAKCHLNAAAGLCWRLNRERA